MSNRFRFPVSYSITKLEKYSHFCLSRMAGRAAGHRYKVGGWDIHVGEANESEGRHFGSDHVEKYDAM